MKIKLFRVLFLAVFLFIFSLASSAYAATASTAPDSGNITIVNNVGKADTVNVAGLLTGDVIKVYNASSAGRLLGTATVASNRSDATVLVTQLGSAGGSVYISVTSKGMLESSRTEGDFDAEPQTGDPDPSQFTIVNNAGKSDTIDVSGLGTGDVVKVYSASSGGKLLGSATVTGFNTDAIVTIKQLGTALGAVYISVTSKGMLESNRIEGDYDAEPVSVTPDASYITILNNVSKVGTLEFDGLTPGDTVKVYNSSLASAKLLGTAKVPSNSTFALVSVGQLAAAGGNVYVSLSSVGEDESVRTLVPFDAQSQSDAPDVDNITITNNAGMPDIVLVDGLSIGDVAKVYNAATKGSLLGSAAVPGNNTEAKVSIAQLGTTGGSVYVSITSTSKLESTRTQAFYSPEPKSDTPDINNITVVNNAVGTADTVTVIGLTAGEIVKVYDSASKGKLLGSATVAAGGTQVVVSIVQLSTTGGSVYVSFVMKGEFEGNRTEADYSAESKSVAPSADNVTITNNVGKADTVDVCGVSASSTVKVYDSISGGKLLGSAKVPASNSEVTVSITQLSSAAGSAFISVTNPAMNESDRTEVDYSAETVSNAPSSGNILVTNNPAGTPDTIYVSQLSAGDTVRVYSLQKSGNLLTSVKVAASKSDATASIAQLGTTNGSVFVSVTSVNMLESSRTEADYLAEVNSIAPDPNNIIVTNNPVGTPDTVAVTGLLTGDVAKVYDSAVGGKLLGSATMSAINSQATVSIAQLGTTGGSVYVSVTSTGDIESGRTPAAYLAEAISDAPLASNIIVTNNAGAADTVEVTGLSTGDVAKVYDSAKGGKLLGSATEATYAADVTINIAQLGTTGGSVYVSVTSASSGTNPSKLESARTPVTYLAEAQTTAPDVNNIIVANNPIGTPDTVQVANLTDGDVIKVYDSASGGKLLGTAALPSAKTVATVSIAQLGSTGGSVFVTVTSTDLSESNRTAAVYLAEAQSDAPLSGNIIVTNNAGIPDTVQVNGLSSSDVVNVYDAAKGGNLLGSTSVSTGSTQVTISIMQLGTTGGSVYVSITSLQKLESNRTEADYTPEPLTAAPDISTITITNNAGIPDTVVVTGLSANDQINIYDALTGGNLLGSAVVSVYASQATITITQLGSIAGNIYVSNTSLHKLESNRTMVGYLAEPVSTSPSAANITIVNNSGVPGTVTVIGLVDNDVVNVYDSLVKGNLLGTATVPQYSTQAVVTIPQLGSAAGSVYVTVTSKGKNESDRTQANFNAKPQTTSPDVGNITVVNNAGIPDTITVIDLGVSDIVNVYDAAQAGTQLGSATVASNSSQVIISISQLSTTAGSVYITVTTTGKTESGRTEADYIAEQSSTTPNAGNITIVNNSGMSGTVTVTGLLTNDVVKVYDAATAGNLIGTATMASNNSQAVVTVPQLGTSAGNLYISVTSVGKTESVRTMVGYAAVSNAPDVGNVVIVNNAVIASTVTVSSLAANDTIKVYDSLQGGNLLGSANVPANGTSAIVTIPQLTTGAGSVYITVTSFGRTESTRSKVDYIAQQTSNTVTSVSIANNAVIADTITVSSLTSNDVINVYDSLIGGTLLGTATVQTSSTQATVTVAQLGTGAGTVYITVTSLGKTESARTPESYMAEQISNGPSISNVIIVNSSGSADTVTVTGLNPYDVVKLYDSSVGDNLLYSATVQASSTQVIITIPQLGTGAGDIYLSVTSLGKNESLRQTFSYAAEN